MGASSWVFRDLIEELAPMGRSYIRGFSRRPRGSPAPRG